MDMGIKGKTAVVCGASRGLGRACADVLAAEGVNLVLCSRNFENIFNAARSISETFGVETVPIAADISLPESPEKVAHEAIKKFGGIDILINNAGGPPPGTFDITGDDNWEKAFNLTLMSAVRMTRAVLPYMKEKKWGRIVNLTSISVKQPIQNLLLSNSLRSAVIGMAKTLSQEAGHHNILVNNIATGNFDTERLRSIFSARAKARNISEEQALKEAESSIPLGRLGKPEELAWLVTFLASERASYITGSTIQVDGGLCGGIL
jgi:3-oxoacyl-[acyl-carrier protein] reductase